VSKWRQPTDRPNKSVHHFTGDTYGKTQNNSTPYQQELDPIAVFSCCILHMLSLLVEKTNRYYHQYLDTLDDGPSPLTDVTESEMFLFLALIIQMRHDI
jgi:hypothetical protein